MLFAGYGQSLSIFGEQKVYSDISKDKIVYQIGSGKLLINHLDGNVDTQNFYSLFLEIF